MSAAEDAKGSQSPPSPLGARPAEGRERFSNTHGTDLRESTRQNESCLPHVPCVPVSVVDRSALKRLMADIEADKVECVLVYKGHRLSRSLLDFARETCLSQFSQSIRSRAPVVGLSFAMGRRPPQTSRACPSSRYRFRLGVTHQHPASLWSDGNSPHGARFQAKPSVVH